MDLGDDPVHLTGDGQQGHAAVAFGVPGDEVGEPAVVGLRAGHAQLGVLVAGEAEADPEGGCGAAVHGVRVGEDDLGRHPVAVELLEPLGAVPAAPEALLVVVEPLVGEGLVAYAEAGHLLAAAVAAGQEVVELAVVAAVEIGPVLLGGQSGVAVGGDDQVRVVSHR